MLENIILWLILGGSALFISRKLYRQWRAAFDPKAGISCDCSCSGCGSAASCDEGKKTAL